MEQESHQTVEFRLEHEHNLIDGESAVLEHGSKLLARCVEQESVFVGENRISCRDGHWTPSLPHCIKTYQAGRGFGVLVELTYILVEAVCIY